MTIKKVDQIGVLGRVDYFTVSAVTDKMLHEHRVHYPGKDVAPRVVLLTLSNCTEITVTVQNGRIVGRYGDVSHNLWFASELQAYGQSWDARSNLIKVGDRVVVEDQYPSPRGMDHFPVVALITVYEND